MKDGLAWLRRIAEQQRAKDLDKYIEAQLYDTRFYEARAQAWLATA